jgi:hypothetical protein
VSIRIGVAHHLGWAVVVAAGDGDEVVDRRRIELVEPGVQPSPVHHAGGTWAMHGDAEPPDDETLAALVARVRASAVRATSSALDELAASTAAPVVSLSVREWPARFPSDIAALRRVPYESRADSVMYCQVLADVAADRGWAVHCYDAKTVEAEAARALGAQAHDVLHGPRATLGPPWTKDHRVALAAAVLARVCT